MARRTATVAVETGLQARAAVEFARVAGRSTAPVHIRRAGGEPVDAKSLLLVIAMDVRTGEDVELEGDDAVVLDALAGVLARPLPAATSASGGLRRKPDIRA
ncbi:phosphocarrier protein [Stackebrandtia albiflava]|uniref:Phosphocarrier protein n=1 Tax=Stackebrandtia albiflava TaxID=406432 RepID=A0A562UY19_9ACTN|nr:HPr family phosphocarrier protein [Stackebrandtia albiflava]TWJ10483.1 phosphocarrier protein [Stackebrandtia albiflava]